MAPGDNAEQGECHRCRPAGALRSSLSSLWPCLRPGKRESQSPGLYHCVSVNQEGKMQGKKPLNK